MGRAIDLRKYSPASLTLSPAIYSYFSPLLYRCSTRLFVLFPVLYKRAPPSFPRSAADEFMVSLTLLICVSLTVSLWPRGHGYQKRNPPFAPFLCTRTASFTTFMHTSFSVIHFVSAA
jgi:hypothetical protein